MKIWELDYRLKIIETGPPRSPGHHLSDVTRDLALRGKQLKREYADRFHCGCGQVFDQLDFPSHACIGKTSAIKLNTMHPEKIELGLAWEERLSKHHPEICFHPGELIVDGLPMTVDGMSYSDSDTVSIFHLGNDTALHEFKLTWKSSRRGIIDEWMWMTQDKGYLHGMSVNLGEKVRKVYQHVYWVNGNYSRGTPEGQPSYRIYGMEFSDLEVAENWQMILNHHTRMTGGATRMKLER